MNNYSLIDYVLSDWAIRNSIVWLSEYQNTEVRTFFLNAENRARVQIWIDPPREAKVEIHVYQHKFGTKKRRSDDFICRVNDLSHELDKALKLATDWLNSSR
mgnify:CR=1 FL=1